MSSSSWALEVVRGRSIGRRYALAGPRATLGNSAESGGVNLSGEEGDGPRKMAARQAEIELAGAGLRIRDLDSPGGTFVNRKRLLPDQALALADGDVIQLGGVQLRVVHVGAAPQPAAPSPRGGTAASFAWEIAPGVVCRTWDEVLISSAQRWSTLREMLNRGMIDSFVRGIGRPDLAPPASGTPDRRLDSWIGRLPTTRPKEPILDAGGGKAIVVRVAPGGGRTRRTIPISNVGYRLLEVGARVVEGADWLEVVGDARTGKVEIIDSGSIDLEIIIPATLDRPRSGAIEIESNGGRARVELRLEASGAVNVEAISLGSGSREAAAPLGWSLAPHLRRIAGPVLGASARATAALGSSWLAGTSGVGPNLPATAIAFGCAAAIVGVAFGSKSRTEGGNRMVDAATAGAGSGLAGMAAGAVFVGFCRTIEPWLGSLASSWVAMVPLWALLGLAAAEASIRLLPPGAATVEGGDR
ncbi:MAG: FHA domain-containing protein [Isosphaeraceae bacterium]|nr:FHA domain-containing protein [Isosphaeraceae bacterium]